uniref:Uncharacterized protein n=1 Tax=Nelumbo nucifera TaxID=4432 RepID=A0A822YUL4_NELNU|nr:TPA_asm: hypothetical protein HUJ06_005749 [Nelumbo nucifera]
MVSLNSTVKHVFRNTATFSGVHVTSTPVDLSYSQLSVASGIVSNKTHLMVRFSEKIKMIQSYSFSVVALTFYFLPSLG